MLQVCSKTITQIPDYIQIVGIILGMCTLGYLGDKIGRKWGSVFTASIMLIGAILLTAVDAPSEKGFVIMYIVAQVSFIGLPHCMLAQHICSARVLTFSCTLYTCCQHDNFAQAEYIIIALHICSSAVQLFLVQSILTSSRRCLFLFFDVKQRPFRSSPSVTELEESTPWLLVQLLSVLRPRAVPLPERGVVR